MDITPEKLAFIEGTKVPQNAPVEQVLKPLPLPETDEPKERDRTQQRHSPRPVPRQNQRVETNRQKPDATILQGLLVPLTTRLQPETADALRRAYLEQKLARQSPSTQQEIVEAALQEWLKKNAYL